MGIYPSTHKTLLKKIQDGDEISWKEFYDRYSPVIRTVCVHSGLSQSESEDVRQNVMLKIFRNRLIFSYKEEKARFRTYFNQIIHSCIADYLRGRGNGPEIPCEKLPDAPDPSVPEDPFAEEWCRQCLQDALDILKEHVEPKTFLAFHMAVFQKKKNQEIAGFLQISVPQVYLAKSRCSAKLKEIASELRKEDPDLNLQWDF